MQKYERFGACLKRCLKESGMSASEAAKLVGFRSRNSMFRILSGEAGEDINLRFLDALHKALGNAWPEKRWRELQEALRLERLGLSRYLAHQAFDWVLQAREDRTDFNIWMPGDEEGQKPIPLRELLAELAGYPRVEMIITGLCDFSLSRTIAECCGEAGQRGMLTIRHYIDTAEETVTQNILGVLPLVSKPWYNARLVAPDSCPKEMMAIYRLNIIYIQRWDEAGHPSWMSCLRYDEGDFKCSSWIAGECIAIEVVDKWRFHLELLKPLAKPSDGPEAFVAYTEQYRQLEENCTLLSIKPDVHFNCIRTSLLKQAVLEGFDHAGVATGPELDTLMEALVSIHDRRFDNMLHKRKVTHMVYSLPEMERFMRTGVMSDQFFIQRAYTVEERRMVIRTLLDAMRTQPWFNVHFLKENAPELHYEITFYDGKGVLLMDAYTGYELDKDHSEALITLPAFMESFRTYFMDELLPLHVRPRAETISILEGLLVMNAQDER